MRTPRCEGLVKPDEGRRLAYLAARVPASQAIVEIGSHTGGSTCWMAHAATAHVTAVDPWADPRPDTLDDPFALVTGDAVYERFSQNLTREGLWGKVTPLRTFSLTAAAVWVQPVGLLFIDAIHELEAVRSDYLHWQRFIPVGGWLALHDYTEDPEHPYHGVADAVRELIGAEWAEPIVTEYLWTALRIDTATLAG